MVESTGAPADAAGAIAAAAAPRASVSTQAPVYGAIDLGTNNCRLLVATAAGRGFRILDGFSRIVRLGEGLSASGRLTESAMERAMAALAVCAERMRRRGVSRMRAVATQACRAAANGPQFVDLVLRRTGIALSVISPREEARLAVVGCAGLLDPAAQAALVLDVGGGSTELSWLDLAASNRATRPQNSRPRLAAWLSLPFGVVTLAERFPEPKGDAAVVEAHFRGMVAAVRQALAAFTGADGLRERFAGNRAHIVGSSGAITSLAALHLRLPRYERRRVDGLWMTRAECDVVTRSLMGLTVAERAAEPCIGPGRADLVLAGAALLAAVQSVWPCERVRVADRGLREGLLISLIAADRAARRRSMTVPLLSHAHGAPA